MCGLPRPLQEIQNVMRLRKAATTNDSVTVQKDRIDKQKQCMASKAAPTNPNWRTARKGQQRTEGNAQPQKAAPTKDRTVVQPQRPPQQTTVSSGQEGPRRQTKSMRGPKGRANKSQLLRSPKGRTMNIINAQPRKAVPTKDRTVVRPGEGHDHITTASCSLKRLR